MAPWTSAPRASGPGLSGLRQHPEHIPVSHLPGLGAGSVVLPAAQRQPVSALGLLPSFPQLCDLYFKHRKLSAGGPRASLIWPVLAFKFDILALHPPLPWEKLNQKAS